MKLPFSITAVFSSLSGKGVGSEIFLFHVCMYKSACRFSTFQKVTIFVFNDYFKEFF